MDADVERCAREALHVLRRILEGEEEDAVVELLALNEAATLLVSAVRLQVERARGATGR